ncbi:hypothetical protein DEO72_LG10g3120 [Vigna unguiculata]|uniref:Uncharacterized protein n=1 Tax=Vigna unguiculata TaxID=3917 RepID=A0A4D6NG49_VIGUN|nr:hypothetical protein DEO72_LG10g3120 [Vigna unguiculata]
MIIFLVEDLGVAVEEEVILMVVGGFCAVAAMTLLEVRVANVGRRDEAKVEDEGAELVKSMTKPWWLKLAGI